MEVNADISEALALTEKKMDMTLDDIIRMSKNNMAKPRRQRVLNRRQKPVNSSTLDKSTKIRKFMDSRSVMRQGVLAQRRSNFEGNGFPLASQAARKAPVALKHNGYFNRSKAVRVNKPRVGATSVPGRSVRTAGFGEKQSQQQVKVVTRQQPRTLDSLFANMSKQKTRIFTQQKNVARRNPGGQRIPPWHRAAFGN